MKIKTLPSRAAAWLKAKFKTGKAIPGGDVTVMVNGEGVNLGIPLSKLSDYSSYLRAMSKKIWVLWRCSTLKAQLIAETEWETYRGEGDDRVRIRLPDLEALLKSPNSVDTGREILYRTALHMFATGNAFWYKSEANKSGERPRELFMLNPKRMTIMTDSRRGVVGYTYFPVISEDSGRGVSAIPFDVEEIIHFKQPHPDNDFWGLGEVEAGETLFNSWVNQSSWEESYWGRGATPTTLLIGRNVTVPGGEPGFRKLKARWEAEYGGVKNAGKTAWLTGDWSKETMGMTVRDMEAIEQSRWTCEQIAHLCGVPLSMIGLQGAANYATAKVDDVRFRRDTIKPALKFMAARITKGLVGGYSRDAVLDYVLSGLVNVDEITAGFTGWFDRGVVSINEIRDMLGMGKLDEPIYDQHFINAGLVPLDVSGISNLGTAENASQEIVRRFILDQSKRSETLTR